MAKPTLFLGHIGQVLVQYGHVLVQYEPIPDLHLLNIGVISIFMVVFTYWIFFFVFFCGLSSFLGGCPYIDGHLWVILFFNLFSFLGCLHIWGPLHFDGPKTGPPMALTMVPKMDFFCGLLFGLPMALQTFGYRYTHTQRKSLFGLFDFQHCFIPHFSVFFKNLAFTF